MKRTFVGTMGIILIVIGILGAIGIWLSFDWEEWGHIKTLTLSQSEVIEIMRGQRNNAIIMGFVSLVGNLAVGSVLLALDQIINLLRGKSRDAKNNDAPTKSSSGLGKFIETTINK